MAGRPAFGGHGHRWRVEVSQGASETGKQGRELACTASLLPCYSSIIASRFEGSGSYWLCDFGSVTSLSEPWLCHP